MKSLTGTTWLFLAWIGLVGPLLRLSATPPFPNTFICRQNDQWVVWNNYLGGPCIFVKNASDKTLLELGLKEAIPKQDYDKFVHQTTAGPAWADFAVHYFVTLEGRRYFAVRTWWDRRILIDLEKARQVKDRKWGKALSSMETRFVLDTLKPAGQLMARWTNTTLDQIETVHAAAHLAGRMRLEEAVPFLRQLEAVDYQGESVLGMRYFGKKLADGIDPSSYSVYTTRRVVQLSLRRLGQRPATLAATAIESPLGLVSEFGGPRHERTGDLRRDMRPATVLGLLGSPDYVVQGRGQGWQCAWRYDVDTVNSYTLLVLWDDEAKVKCVYEAKPAFWAGPAAFEARPGPATFDADGSVWFSGDKRPNLPGFKGSVMPLQ